MPAMALHSGSTHQHSAKGVHHRVNPFLSEANPAAAAEIRDRVAFWRGVDVVPA